MITRLVSYFFCFFSVLFLLSCGDLTEPDFRSIANVRVSKLGLSESTLSLHLNYFNPNKFRLKLRKAEGDAWIENSYLGHFIMDTTIQIPAKGEFRLPVKLQVDMARVFKNSLLTFLAKEVTIKVEGEARVGKGLVYINYPIRYEGKQNLQQLMK